MVTGRVMQQRIRVWTLVVCCCAAAGAVAQPLSVSTRDSAATGMRGMVATAHPLASEAALSMLQRGGNAVDAAVAAAFAIGVVEPDGSGLGGGGGALIYLAKEKRAVYINYYPAASSAVNSVGFIARTHAQSARAILVPGTVAGLTLALERFGTLPLATVLGPAIRLARDGFPIDETLGQIILDHVPLVGRDSATASVYLHDGFPLVAGDTLRQPDLANTLTAIAVEGRAGFYEGPIARALAEGVQSAGGAMTLDDLRSTQAQLLEPVRGTYRGFDIYSAPPPHSGVHVLEALNILENENLAALGHYTTSGDAMHRIAETLRRVYADRTAYLADPRFEDVPVEGLVSKAFAQSRFNDINPNMADPREYRKTSAGNPAAYRSEEVRQDAVRVPVRAGSGREWDDEDDEGSSSYDKWGEDLFGPWGNRKKRAPKDEDRRTLPADSVRRTINPDELEPEALRWRPGSAGPRWAGALHPGTPESGGHTTHLGIMDREGNVVSLTQTLGTFFGSGVTVAGVLLNNAMSNFATTVARNAIEPGKQPRSSISPTIMLRDGKAFMSVGSPGASRIIASVVELILNVVDYGMTAQEANTAPRFHCQKADDYLHLEARISEKVQDDLRQKGHSLKLYSDFDLFFGGAQLILRDPATGILSGSADPRRGGVAIGY